MSELFSIHETKQISIFLIDASGSVVFDKFEDAEIFDYIKKLIGQMNLTEHRVIFWNSDHNTKGVFKNGIFRPEFVVKKETLDQTFKYVRNSIDNFSLTFPHLAFEAIPDSWISKTEQTKIYFITDGKMGYGNIPNYELNDLKKKLGDSIENLFKKHPNVSLNIITVEAKYMDFDNIETLKVAAGCDVYNVVMEKKLTKYITKFTSYSFNNKGGHVHINKNIPPKGFIPFEDKYFSELKVNQFIKYLAGIIEETKSEDDLLKIVQALSTTLSYLTKDKPQKIVDDIIKNFCRLFEKTSLDAIFVQFIITDAIQQERAGQAEILTNYRNKLKNLYKQANELLFKNVKDAIGIKETFLTLPYDGKIIEGNSRSIDQSLNIKNHYPVSAIKVNHVTLPVIPFEINNSLMSQQCLRQWIRSIVGKQYSIDPLGDIVIHTVLGIMLRIVLSDIDDGIKDAFRNLALVMLRKKRMNSDMTELDKIESGDLPIPNNGKTDSLFGFLNKVSGQLNIKVKPLTLWYAFCLALKNQKLIDTHLIHCKDALMEDGIEPDNLLNHLKNRIKPVLHHVLPLTDILDYKCLITLEDTSQTGGFRFLPHQTISGNSCCPIYVLSVEGYEQLLSSENSAVCPICYASLDRSCFEKVNPRSEIQSEIIFAENIANIFIDAPPIVKHNINTQNNGILIFMKGTVGAGKSTCAEKIKELVAKIGGYCIVEGMDKYTKTGMKPAKASKAVTNALKKIDNNNDNLKVVVIDTCGVQNNPADVFGYNFSSWKVYDFYPNLDKSKMEGYLAWSLKNVLSRGKPGKNDNFSLNPVTAGVNVCVDVHRKKATALFGDNIPNVANGDNIDVILNTIRDRADQYTTSIKTVDQQVEEFCSGKIC